MQQITDTVPLCFYILPSYETGKSVQQITDTVPLCFYILPSYETGKSVQQILILSLMFLHFAKL